MMLADITFASYAAAGLAYLLLTLLLLVRWRSRALSIAVIVATVITAMWGVVVALSTFQGTPSMGLMRAVEITRNSAWLFVILAIYGARLRATDSPLAGRRWLPWYVGGIIVAVVVLLVAPMLQGLFALPDTYAKAAFYAVWLSMSISGMLILENLYRNSDDAQRWWTKYLCLGLGVLFMYDFFMYAGALMMQELSPLLVGSRGFIVALTAPFVGLAVARSGRRRGRGNLPQHVVFHTLTLLSAGVYLLIMAAVAVFLSSFSDSWAGVLELTFFATGGLFLLALFLSDTTRSRVNVWLSKNFFSYKYDYRQEWLEFTETLEQAEADAPLAIIQAMAKLATCDAGLLWAQPHTGRAQLVGEWQVGDWQLSSTEAAADYSAFFGWLRNTRWIVEVEEWRQKPSLYIDLDLPDSIAQASGQWLVIPLMFGEQLQGVLLLRRMPPVTPLNWEDRDLLKVAGRQAASHLAQYTANQSVIELRQFEAFNRTSAYVVHDLKNILAEQSLIVSNAVRHHGNQAFYDDVIETVEDSVGRMTRLMGQMKSGLRGGKSAPVELCGLLRNLAARISDQPPAVQLMNAGQECWLKADAEQLATVFGHLLQNAREAAGKNGQVAVSLTMDDRDNVVVTIEDNGIGMSEGFIQHRLFKPFDSTKGLTGMGIGAFESRELIRALGGDIQVVSEEGVGSVFRIVLPCEVADKTLKPAAEDTASG